MNEKVLSQISDVLEKQTAILANMQEKEMLTKVASTNTAPLIFGSGGLMSNPGNERDVITAYVRPSGLVSELPAFGSVVENPMYATITGVEGDGASPATNPCDANPSGFIQGCTLTAQFGRTAFDTQTIEFDKVMLQVNRGVMTDLQLRGRLLGLENLSLSGLNDSDVLDIVTASEMVKVGMLMQRGTTTQMGLNRQCWQGNIANNTTGGGYKEFPGLDSQIATGQKDAVSGSLCPASDSFVKDFAYDNVDGSGTLDIVEYVAMMEFNSYYNAEKMGLNPVEWVLVMRPELWQEFTAVWPIAYNTNRGASVLSGNNRLVVDGGQMIQQRDAMRRGMTIEINGRTHKVVTDTGIYEANNTNDGNVPAGSFASSIYFVPLSITGGFPVTYVEYVDYRQGARDTALLQNKQNFWTDGGAFSWALSEQRWCYQLSAKTEQRIVLRTPQLAGRIDNVLYAPLAHLRESVPGSPYEFDGGVSTRTAATTYATWK